MERPSTTKNYVTITALAIACLIMSCRAAYTFYDFYICVGHSEIRAVLLSICVTVGFLLSFLILWKLSQRTKYPGINLSCYVFAIYLFIHQLLGVIKIRNAEPYFEMIMYIIWGVSFFFLQLSPLLFLS